MSVVSDQPELLEVRGLVQEFRRPRHLPFAAPRVLHAVSGVSCRLQAGECLGLVGETGCGKSTLARAIMQAPPPVRGQVRFQGQDLVGLSRTELRQARRGMQYVFQDPYASLDPTWRVRELVAEPMRTVGGLAAGRWTRVSMRCCSSWACRRTAMPRAGRANYPAASASASRSRGH